MQIPEEEYTPELARRLREKYWGEQDPNEILVIEGIDEVIFDSDESEPPKDKEK